jgi:membrane protein YdbS with pleckstrin-like domain
MKLQPILYVIVGILFTVGILVTSFTEIFSENWFIGLGLIGICVIVIVITVIAKMKSKDNEFV